MIESRLGADLPEADRWLVGGGELAALIAARDWSTSSLGPLAQWPQSLRTALSICLNSRFPIAIWWGGDGIQFYNAAYLPVVGAKHPDSMGRPAAECWSEAWPVVGSLYDHVVTTGESTWSEDLRIPMRRFGFDEESYFTFSYSAIRDESGGVGGVQVTCIETTERVLSERRLKTLRELSAQTGEARAAAEAWEAAMDIIAAAPSDVPFAALYVLDADLREATLVRAVHLAPGAVCPPTVDLGSEPQKAWPIAQVATTGECAIVGDVIDRFGVLPSGSWADPPRTAVVVPVAQPGQHRPAAVLIAGVSPARPLDESYRGYFELLAQGLAASMANARAYEDQRRRADELAALDRAKTAFFSNVSHEFRTPLTLLLGPLEDVLAGGLQTLPDSSRAALQMAHRNSLRLLKLVNTLLDFSRIEAGRVQANYEPTDLAGATAEVASVFRSAIEKAGLSLDVDCPLLPEPVFVDREMWEKIVLNLLSNAFKFTFEGSIGVTLRWEGDCVELRVHDTGTGIAPGELPKVFDRFHRIHGAPSRTHEGTGIGLALVQELAGLHGGSVVADSVEGVGTTFTVRIKTGTAHLPADRISTTPPLASTRLGPAPFVEEALRWLPTDAPPGAVVQETEPLEMLVDSGLGDTATRDTPPRRRPRIVWADDNADMRQYVTRLLGSIGEVEAVADGHAALAAIHRDTPALVLADVMMPRLDGIDLLRAIRSDPATADVPVILLSARAGEESRVEGMRAGADDYVTKPFSARELMARVDGHLKIAQLRAESRAALRASEARLAEELADTQHLQRLSSSLITEDGDRGLYDHVLATARALLRADMASVQRLVPERRALFLLACHGLEPDSAQFWEWVAADDTTSSGRAVVTAEPVMVSDVGAWDPLTGTDDLAHYRHCGIRSMLSAPLIARDGQIVGVISTHWHEVHHSSERERTLLELVARQVADLLERRMMIEALRRRDERQAFLLELADVLRPISDIQEIPRVAMRALGDHLKAGRLLYAEVSGDGETLVVADDYRRGDDLNVVSPDPLSDFATATECLRAGQHFITADSERDARFSAAERQAMLALGNVSLLAVPCVKNNRWVSTLAASHSEPHEWTGDEIALVEEVAERTCAAVERARAEAALRESEERLRGLNEDLEERVRARTAEIKALFDRLVTAQEEERSRIARDIHDQFGQQMTALRMNLEALTSRTEHDVTLAAYATRTQQLAEELDRSIDFLTRDLRPAALDHLGLAAALEELVRGWSDQFGIAAEFVRGDTELLRLTPDVEANVYRLAQEVLHNVVKHADATHVGVSLQRRDNRLLLVIEDNGCGFAVSEDGHRAANGGLGLVSMRERAALIGGTLDIESVPGEGTSIFVRVALSEAENAVP